MIRLNLEKNEIKKQAIHEQDNGHQSPLPSFILTKNGV